jgi:hypothetical protein
LIKKGEGPPGGVPGGPQVMIKKETRVASIHLSASKAGSHIPR